MKPKEANFKKYEWEEIPLTGLVGLEVKLRYKPVSDFLYTVSNPPPTWRLNALRGMSQIVFIRAAVKANLADIAIDIGIGDDKSRATLQRHMQRWRGYYKSGAVLAILLYLLSTLIWGFVLFSILKFLFQNVDNVPTVEAFGEIFVYGYTFFFIFLYWFFLQLGKRLYSTIISKYFADTLSVIGALHLMVDLLRKSALDLPVNRKHLQVRISFLSRHISLMASQFKGETVEGARWIDLHFDKMARFVREHERLVVIPQKDSLEVLRRDFYMLLQILISGNYGEFNYEFQEDRTSKTSARSRAAGVLLTIIGLAVPSLVIFLLYTNPQQVSRIGVDVNTVVIIALAWLLLTVDVTLKLGIVERITGLAKAIRDLG